MSFLGGIFTGSSKGLDSAAHTASGIAGYGTAVGEGDISASSGFMRDILSGDPAKIAKLLAPQISEVAKNANEKTRTNAEFGNRSGGTNASNQTTMDTARATVNDMISRLTGGAADKLADIGTTTLGLGLNANQQAAGIAQQQLENQKDSIFGQGISYGVGTLEGFGLGKIPGMGPGH